MQKKKLKNKDYIGGYLTTKELFTLYRRRLGISQEEFGKQFGVTEKTMQHWENRKSVRNKDYQRAKTFLEHHFLEHILNGLTELEVSYIIRKRLGLYQKDVAQKLGISRVWLNRIERGLEPLLITKLFKYMTNLSHLLNQRKT